MFVTLFGYLLAVCIGISLGLIGGGGSILAAPILIYIMDVPTKSALAMTLVIVGVASLIGVIPHWRQGNVNMGIVAMFAPSAMLGAYLGARLASFPFVNPTLQLVIFGIMMLIAAAAMIRKGSKKAAHGMEVVDRDRPHNPIPPIPPLQPLHPLQSIQHHHQAQALPMIQAVAQPVMPQWVVIALEGFFVGTLTGFIGIGGGFLVIPALVLLGKTPMREAVGTSLAILTLKSATGFAGYLGHVPIDWTLLMAFTIAASIGILAGSELSRLVSTNHLEKGFGYFVLIVAVFVLVQR